MKQYLEIMEDIYTNGRTKKDRTRTGTRQVFGRMFKHNLKDGFPLLTTKKVHIKSAIIELIWFLSGATNIKFLNDNGVTIWDEWATPDGELGPVYGKQWRAWVGADGKEYDQITALIEGIKINPNSRRHIVNAWNVADLPDELDLPESNALKGKMALAPCHVMYQFDVCNGELSCKLDIRSSDFFLGFPFNLASVAFFTHMVAQQCDLIPADLAITTGDTHLYSNHFQQTVTQLSRVPTTLPALNIKRRPNSIFEYNLDDFEILNYNPQAAIPAPISK